MELTQEDIDRINKELPYDEDGVTQGVYHQPFGAPDGRDELFVYMRWESEGFRGGNCWGNEPQYYKNEEPDNLVLEAVLNVLAPNIRLLDFKKVERSHYFFTTYDSDYGYYGNSDEYEMKMIAVNDLIKELKDLGYD